MPDLDVYREIATETPAKIVMLIADGLGGLPREPGGKTEIETANTPNLDALARAGMLGLTTPIAAGVTPGSGPSHLALFGMDPVTYPIGRGVLEALGIDFDLQPADVAARGNFCTVDASRKITDRRAGRISSENAARIVDRLRALRVDGAEVLVEPVREHRFVAVFRGQNLSDRLTDTDPQVVGVEPRPVVGLDPAAQETSRIVNEWIAKAAQLLEDAHPANMVTLRGFSKYPDIPTLRDVFKLKACGIAVYPMYRGLAKLVGMDVKKTGPDFAAEIETLRQFWNDFDFFFLHYKYTDSAGEDGDFDRKVRTIEELDRHVPAIMELKPDVLVVTGDHSTPAVMASHSWHPVPLLMWGPLGRSQNVGGFGETECARGSIGHVRHTDVLPLAMAHAGKLAKYGA